MEYAYAAIGRAVFASQMLEVALVPIFEFFRMQAEPGYLEKTGGYIPIGSFKMPVMNIIKALSSKGNIDPELEERLSTYTENRHKLIHRWPQEHGWPDENDSNGFVPIVALANQVETEAKQLTRFFAGYMVKFANQDWATENKVEYTERMKQLFQHAHMDV